MALKGMNDNNINITSNTDATHYFVLGGRRESYVCQGIGDGLEVTASGLVASLGTGQCSVYGRHIIVDNSLNKTSITLPQNASGYLAIEYDLTQALGNEASFKAVTVLNKDDLCNNGLKYDIPLYKFTTNTTTITLTDVRQFDYAKNPVAKLTARTESERGSNVPKDTAFPWNVKENGNSEVFEVTGRYIKVLKTASYDIEFYVEGYGTVESVTNLGLQVNGTIVESPKFYGTNTSCYFRTMRSLNAGDSVSVCCTDTNGFTYNGGVTHYLKVKMSQDEQVVANPYIEKEMVVTNVYKLPTGFTISASSVVANTDSRNGAYPYVYVLNNSVFKSTHQAKVAFRSNTEDDIANSAVFAGATDCLDGSIRIYFNEQPSANIVVENLTYWEVL